MAITTIPVLPRPAQSLLRSRIARPVLDALTSPHGVDRYLELVHPMLVANEVRATITDVKRETMAGEPVATITLQPTSSWDGHKAGQFVQLGVEVASDSGWARRTRCFSVSSAESGRGARQTITITMRANPDGEVSKHLVNHAKVGDLVTLSQADGEFILPDVLPTELLLISGGSGITPCMSILRTLLRRGYGGTIHFLHYAQSADHQIFATELADLPPNVRVHLVYPELGGRNFSALELERLVGDFTRLDTWACGPAGLIGAVETAYADSDRLRVEYFKVGALGGTEGGGTLRFDDADLEAENTGATILEQAEAAGLTPTFGCRMGICFSCTTRKTEGTVRNLVTGVESSQPDEDIRICVSAPVGGCAVDL